MKILLVINGTDIGGTETALTQIAGMLDRRGHQVEVVSLKRPGSLASRIREAGIPVDTLAMGESSSFAELVKAVLKLRTRLKGRSYHVIHSFLPRANIISRIANRCSPGRVAHISSERSTDFLRSRVVTVLNRLTAPWTDLVLAVTPAVRTTLIQRDRLPREKIDVLENGLDLSEIDRQSPAPVREMLSIPDGELLFCTVGRLVPVKGHRFLLEALAKRKRAAKPVHLLVVGDGPERQDLRQLASEGGLKKRVHFLGVRHDVPAILKSVDGFVLPSLQEGISVALIEAMACSCPIIATRVGGTPEILTHEATGLLVEPADIWGLDAAAGSSFRTDNGGSATVRERGIQELGASIDRLAGDPELRVRLGKAARREVEQRFDLQLIVSRLETIYEDPSAVRPKKGEGMLEPWRTGSR